MASLQCSVVRIENVSSGSTSAGFVTYDGLICTCAHGVVERVGGQDVSKNVDVYFDDRQTQPFKATVDIKRVDLVRDVAFLRFEEEVPAEMPPALPIADFIDAPNGRGAGAHVIRGYPLGLEIAGVTRDIAVAAPFVQNGVQLLSVGATTRGFSGGPVWDVARRCVVGMVIERYQLEDGLAGGLAVSSCEIRSVAQFNSEFAANPHRFLEPFAATEDDARLYFGREAEVRTLHDALEKNRMVIVSGDSGVGKSSFVRAGLFNALKLAPPGTRMFSFTAGSDPLLALAVSLAAQFPSAVDGLEPHTLALEWIDSPKGAAEILVSALGPHGVVSLDQYERMATECKEPARRRALNEIIKLSSEQGLRWLVAVRSDFPVAATELPSIAPRHILELQPMERAELRETIVEPAQACHRVYAPGVVDVLVDAVVGQPAALALLQFSLSKLWEVDVQSAIITDEMLARLGFDGKKGDLLSILRTYAQQVWSGLSESGKTVAPNLLAKFAVVVNRQLPGGGNGITFAGRQVADAELDQVSRSIAEKLARSHLLVVTKALGGYQDARSNPEARNYSLAHEFLLTAWSELSSTCQKSERGITFYAGDFSYYLKLFQRGKSEVRLPKKLLEEAEALIKEFPQLEGLFEGDSKALIEASRKATDDERRRRRIVAGLVAGLLVAVVISGYLYFAHKTTLQTQARVFESHGTLALADRNFAEAEIFFAKSLTFADRETVRDLLLQARSAGVSVGARSEWGAGEKPSLATASRDGTSVAQYDGEQSVAVYRIDDVANQTSISVPSGTDALWLFTSAQGDKYLAVSSGAPGGRFALHLFGIDNHNALRKIDLVGKDGTAQVTWKRRVSQVAYDEQHNRFLVSSEDASLGLFSLSDGRAQQTWYKPEAHTIAVHGVTFSADGSLAATAGADYAIRIWDVDDETRDPLEVGSHQDSVFAVAFSHDGSRLASGGYDRAIRLWNIGPFVAQWRSGTKPSNGEKADSPQTIRIYQGHAGVILDLRFSLDDTMLASVSKDESARVWDVDRAREVLTLRPQNGPLRTVAFDGYGKDVVLSGDQGWSQWHTSGRKEARKLWTTGSPVSSLAFGRSSKFLAAGDADGRLVRWSVGSNTTTYQDLGSIECREKGDCGINGLATSADGRWLAAAGQGHVANVWDVSTDDWRKLKVS